MRPVISTQWVNETLFEDSCFVGYADIYPDFFIINQLDALISQFYFGRVSCQNKFVKLVQLVGFIRQKFVTMHGHTNIKIYPDIRGKR
jgi:hypothetical protein